MRSLSARLLVLLTIALLPVGLVAVYQTLKVVSEAEKLSENEVLARTVQAARDEFELIKRAQGIAYALGTAAVTLDDPEQCRAVMKRFIERDSQFIFAGFVPVDGVMVCSSGDKTVDFSDSANWKSFLERPRPRVVFSAQGAVTGQPVIAASVPIVSPEGELLGAGSLSFPYSLAEATLDTDGRNLELAVLNREGEILTSSTEEARTRFLERLEIAPGAMDVPPDGMTLGVASRGSLSKIAIVPLIDGESYLVGRWSNTQDATAISFLGTATPVFPVIMWLTSLFVCFFAIERLVLQYLKKLRARMAAFSVDNLSGSYVTLRNAPSEVNDIAASYNQMIDRITRDHAELEKSIREKDILLKEIHHRVKNNLQLIASILNMQLRQIEESEAKSVLRRVQDRVMSLAMIHKSLYTDTQLETVRVDRLLQEIVSGSLDLGSDSGQKLETDIRLSPVELDPDQAVPLSLLVTEALTNAVKYAGSIDDGPVRLTVELTQPVPSRVRLVVKNSCGTQDCEPSQGTGLGARLIDAFVQQLGGQIEITSDNAAYAIHVEFPKLGHADPQSKAA